MYIYISNLGKIQQWQRNQKKVKISFEFDRKDFESIYIELFEMVENDFCDECGDDDGEEDYIELQDRAKDYFEDYTPSEIIKESLLRIRK